MDEKDSCADEQQQREKFRYCQHGDRARTFAHTAHIDRYEGTVNDEHDDDPHHRITEGRRQDGDRVNQNIDHSGDCAESRESVEYAGEETDITTECDFDISVESAGE